MIRPILYTERLCLRPFMPGDAPTVHRLLSSPEISEGTLSISYPYPEGAAEHWIATHIGTYLEKGDIIFALELRATSELIGTMGLHPVPAHHRAEIGYWVGKEYWGNGYATEALKRVIQYSTVLR
jgi:[ribosomal protein S5]-alanine N-acetyltransferase